MRNMFVEGSLLADYLYIGVAILFVAAFIAGYVDSIAGGGGLISVPACLLVGFDPHFALGQTKLVSTLGALGAIRNFIKSNSIIWKILPTGIIASLIGGHIGKTAAQMLSEEIKREKKTNWP